MARWNVGPKNGMWKGGRTVTSHGYVLIRVGKDHHLADSRGYAYEHRLIAERKLGRLLRRGEQIDHENRKHAENAESNLRVARSHAHHREMEGKRNLTRRVKYGRNPVVECACDCGATFRKFDRYGRPRRFVSGHNMRKG